LKKKPLLLLDVDGVLCPFGIDPDCPPEGYALTEIGGVPLWLSKGNVAYLKDLRNYYELAWATMWEDSANELLSPWHNLNNLPYVPFTEYLTSDKYTWREHYKLGAIKEFVGSRPCVWVDDDIDESVLRWASEREEPTLAVPVLPNFGLDEQIVEELRQFATKLREKDEICSGPQENRQGMKSSPA
jgi:hypothetical protein